MEKKLTRTTEYEKLQVHLRADPKRWLITGAGGFIGSHLVQKLLDLGQEVVGLDNFSTGHRENLADIRKEVGPEKWRRFTFLKADIRDRAKCDRACASADYILHQAALGSVPRSLEDPLTSHECNVNGFVNMLLAARDAGVKRFVYASSSSVYGDEETLPKREGKIGRPLSPYAATKLIDEIYAEVLGRCYNTETVGLRYFNVFGPRQDPNGPYAAVIPKWIAAMRRGEPVYIYGNGETSRDFCYVQNVVQANLLAATARLDRQKAYVFNVACNQRTSLNELFLALRESLLPDCPHLARFKPVYRLPRKGDIAHSQAEIRQAARLLSFKPTHFLSDGIPLTVRAIKQSSDSPGQ